MSTVKVDTAKLNEFGAYLKSQGTDFNAKISELSTASGMISSAWTDSTQPQFSSKFGEFITDCTNLGNEIAAYGDYLCGLASKYEVIQSNASSKLGQEEEYGRF